MAEKLVPATSTRLSEHRNGVKPKGSGHVIFDALVRAVRNGGAFSAVYDSELPTKSPFIIYPEPVVDKDHAQEEINRYGAGLKNAGVSRKEARRLTEQLRARFNGGTIYEQQAVVNNVARVNWYI
ncbi:MAG: hypothetical protein Q8Q96_01170 [bacterium]|nr:hypothetical protein [bacterium]